MTIFGPLGPSLAHYVRSSKTLTRWLKPVSLWYADLSGYRRRGLRYDDLRTSWKKTPLSLFRAGNRTANSSFGFVVVEERDDVQKVRSAGIRMRAGFISNS